MTYASPTSMNLSAGIGEFMVYLNTVTEFWISRMLIVAIFIIFTMGYLKSKLEDDFLGAITVGSFASFVVGLPLWLIDFVDGYTFGIIIGALVISTILLMVDKRGQ